MPSKHVAAGSKVKVKINGEEKDLTIVDPNSIDPATGRISYNSPIAQALIGAHPGDITNVTLPNGRSMDMEVISIG